MSMKAIVNGRLVLPGEVLENRALLYDGKILGIVAPGEIPAEAERLDAAIWARTPPTAASRA